MISKGMGDSDWPKRGHVTSVARAEVRFASKKADGDAGWQTAQSLLSILSTIVSE